jgi:glucose-1-phosphate adenylyltransferase
VPNLYDDQWRVYTRSEEMPTAWTSRNSVVKDSLISNGAVIEGTVVRSVLSPGVVVEEGALVEDSVLLNYSRIERGARVRRAIVDKHAVIGRDAALNGGEALVVVGNRAQVAPGETLSEGAVRPARIISSDEFLAAVAKAAP